MTAPVPARAVPAGDAADHLRPLSVGDILDTALRLYRAHFKTFFLVLLAVQLPAFLVQRLYENAAHGLVNLRALTGGIDPARALHPVASLEMLGLFGVLIVIYGVGHGALMAVGGRAWRGETVRPRQAFADLAPRVLPLVGTYVLLLVLAALAGVAGALPGLALGLGCLAAAQGLGALGVGAIAVLGAIVMGLGALAALLFLFLRWFVMVPAVVLEGRGGFGALGRSARLMGGRTGPGLLGLVKVRASLLLLVVFFLLLVPQLLVGVPHYLLMHAYAPAKGVLDPLSVPFALRFPLELVEILIGTVITPFSVLATLLFYFDLRVRREGYDLELRARALGGAPAAGDAAAAAGDAAAAEGPPAGGEAGG